MGMLERTDTAVTISCDACRAVCLVKSESALKSDPADPKAPSVKLDGNVVVRVRHGQGDRRHRRTVGGGQHPIMWNKERRLITIREYPWLCDDCYETGGVGKLDDEWKPLREVFCTACSTVVLRYEDAPEQTCLKCRRGDGWR
jgi:hypothetical protein